MHAVVNHLPLKPDADWARMIGLFEPFFAEVRRQYPKMKAALLLQPSDSEAIFIGVYDDLDTMRHVSSNVAAPWFAENIRPFLGGAAQRAEAPVVAGTI